MVTLVFARKKKPEDSCPTIATAIDNIAADESIPRKRRADICSGARSLCRGLGLQPESTPASPRFFAGLLRNATPASVRMSKGRFRNCRSHLDALMAHAGRLRHRRRNPRTLSPSYQALLARVPDPWTQKRIRRFLGFADQIGVELESIDDAVFDRFHAALRDSTVKNYRTVERDARKLWNQMATTIPGWPATIVTVPTYVDHYVLPADAFPPELWADLDGYLDSRLNTGHRGIEDVLAALESGSEDDEASRRIRTSTADLIRYRVRQFASALVMGGHLRPEQIVSLSVLVELPLVRKGLEFFIERAGGEHRNSQIHGIATDLMMIARLWVRIPAQELHQLKSLCKRLRRRHEGLPESARRSLAPFKDRENVRAFLQLPERIVAEVSSNKQPNSADANRIATALWMQITQRAPLRISNLLHTDLTKNILRSHNGKDARVALYFPAEEVKNSKVLEVPLSVSTARLLDLYLSRYRKLLPGSDSQWLFPAPSGGPQRSNVMSSRMQNLMRENIGFAINPHSYRHVAAKLFLSAHPGRYADVQLLLGHRKLETTIKYYCDLEAEEAFRHFDAVLLGLEEVRK